MTEQQEPQAGQQQEPQAGQQEPQAKQGSTAADTLKAYEALFEKQQQQIADAQKHNDSLQAQINILIRNGGNGGVNGNNDSNSGTMDNLNMPISANGVGTLNSPDNSSGLPGPQEPYVSLADLGHEVGKRDYQAHNTENRNLS